MGAIIVLASVITGGECPGSTAAAGTQRTCPLPHAHARARGVLGQPPRRLPPPTLCAYIVAVWRAIVACPWQQGGLRLPRGAGSLAAGRRGVSDCWVCGGLDRPNLLLQIAFPFLPDFGFCQRRVPHNTRTVDVYVTCCASIVRGCWAKSARCGRVGSSPGIFFPIRRHTAHLLTTASGWVDLPVLSRIL